MPNPIGLGDEQADGIITIGVELVATLDAAVGEYCKRHSLFGFDAMVMLLAIEVMLEGVLVTNFDKTDRVSLMRKVSGHVQDTLRARARMERADA